MKRINYRYTNLPKQILIFAALAYVVMLAIIMAEIAIFKLDGFYEETNFLLTIPLYIVYFSVLFAFLRQYKFFYGEYNDEVLIYHNKLLRKEVQFNLSDAKLAVFDTFGIKFYADANIVPGEDKPIFFFPFFRGGIVEAVSLNNFYKALLERDDMQVIKNFKVLPGYTKKWKIVSFIYAIFAVVLASSLATPIATIVTIFQNH
ncbi:MAG: hypothetical protein IKJ77_05515 [Firmicutes bacterium]|nr:hypothetical protein [Bacillota bacterium]